MDFGLSTRLTHPAVSNLANELFAVALPRRHRSEGRPLSDNLYPHRGPELLRSGTTVMDCCLLGRSQNKPKRPQPSRMFSPYAIHRQQFQWALISRI